MPETTVNNHRSHNTVSVKLTHQLIEKNALCSKHFWYFFSTHPDISSKSKMNYQEYNVPLAET